MMERLKSLNGWSVIALIVTASFVVSALVSLVESFKGGGASLGSLDIWLSIGLITLLIVYVWGGWKSRKDQTVVAKGVFYTITTILCVLAVSQVFFGSDLTIDLLKKGRSVAVESVCDAFDITNPELCPEKESSTNLDKGEESPGSVTPPSETKSQFWDYWSTTAWGRDIDKEWGEGSSRWLWLASFLAILLTLKLLRRPGKQSSYDKGSEIDASGYIVLALIVVTVIAAIVFFLGSLAVVGDVTGAFDDVLHPTTVVATNCPTPKELDSIGGKHVSGTTPKCINIGPEDDEFMLFIEEGYGKLQFDFHSSTKRDYPDMTKTLKASAFIVRLNTPMQGVGGYWYLGNAEGFRVSGLKRLNFSVISVH